MSFVRSYPHRRRWNPAVRSINFGPTVSIDDIEAALCKLDDLVDLPAIAGGHGTDMTAG